jgi:hypothetical protein
LNIKAKKSPLKSFFYSWCRVAGHLQAADPSKKFFYFFRFLLPFHHLPLNFSLEFIRNLFPNVLFAIIKLLAEKHT